jgi:glucose-1-phosphate cytidylyltransferase
MADTGVKVVILAGGLGTRISEESHLRPKPMIEIGGKPILWHVMKIYAAHGLTDFVICLGYRGYMIKEYFANYVLHSSDVTIDARSGEIEYHQTTAEPWRVTLVDTGPDTLTGGRLKRVAPYLGETFCLTYGDGVANIDIAQEMAFHDEHGLEATVASVTPPGRYGALEIVEGKVRRFVEKPPGDEGRINGGFFVLNRGILDRIEGDMASFEGAPMESLAADGQLAAFNHSGFWHAMDTLRDKNHLEGLWSSGKAPWKVWD